MNYNVDGEGDVLVFIHGLSDSLLYWEILATSLKNDYKVVRYDLRGHGSSPLGDGEITMDVYVNDLLGLLDELKIDKVNLAGFSLGGMIALKFAIEYPQRVSSMVLMSSPFKTDDHMQAIFNQFINSLNSSFEEFFDVILPMIMCPDVIESNREELEMFKQMSAPGANTQAYIKAAEACLDFDVEDHLCEIKVPVLILAGKYDDITLLATQQDMYEKIENSKLVVFSDVKHNLLIGENNKKVLDAINEFVKK